MFAAALVDDPKYLRKLRRDFCARTGQPSIEAMVWHYAKGKPKDTLAVQGSLDVTALRKEYAEAARRMPQKQLDAMAPVADRFLAGRDENLKKILSVFQDSGGQILRRAGRAPGHGFGPLEQRRFCTLQAEGRIAA
ncbi:MAG: hypothetical protein H0W24_03145 [Lysobacter sp.]|nr:hypothetical protein [Lysobacter sp.]MBA3641488.1 hypothetical protein [Acidobacteriota bacterium]